MDNDRFNALIRFGLWIAFIVVLVVIARTSPQVKKEPIISPEVEEKEEKTDLSLEEILNNINNNYSYEYTIRIKNLEYTYVGTKMLDSNGNNKEYGFRTIKKENATDSDYFEYFIDNNWTYEVKNGGLDKIDNSKIYNGINADNIDLNKIKESILDIEYTQNDKEYTYNLDKKTIVIIVEENNIFSVKIEDSTGTYDLVFNDINNIKEVNYKKDN